MATISLAKKHTLGPDEALTRARKVFDDFGNRLNASVEWEGNNARFTGRGFSGTAKVNAETIEIDVDLAMLLRPAKGRVEEKISHALDQHFA